MNQMFFLKKDFADYNCTRKMLFNVYPCVHYMLWETRERCSHIVNIDLLKLWKLSNSNMHVVLRRNVVTSGIQVYLRMRKRALIMPYVHTDKSSLCSFYIL